MKESKYRFDALFDELFDEVEWDFRCKDSKNREKAVLLSSFLFKTEEESRFMWKWIYPPSRKILRTFYPL